MSVVHDSAVTMLSEGGVGCSMKWGTKLHYGDVVASGTCKKKNIITTNYSMIIIRNKVRYGTGRSAVSKACCRDYRPRTLVLLYNLQLVM